ncbi:MAG: hypothetical protein HC800_03525 [Phormidesmis sp. RL_2_1]|nr:hypothetical protein [Phormidesmis sp. RL_2_1]
MLVILMKDQLLQPATVCRSCPMANQSGLPRWQQGRLRCGHPVVQAPEPATAQYECTMGFRIAELPE